MGFPKKYAKKMVFGIREEESHARSKRCVGQSSSSTSAGPSWGERQGFQGEGGTGKETAGLEDGKLGGSELRRD